MKNITIILFVVAAVFIVIAIIAIIPEANVIDPCGSCGGVPPKIQIGSIFQIINAKIAEAPTLEECAQFGCALDYKIIPIDIILVAGLLIVIGVVNLWHKKYL
ncbi:MAG: hypothetical protein V1838_03570 [Patescibacteria group bacterium]